MMDVRRIAGWTSVVVTILFAMVAALFYAPDLPIAALEAKYTGRESRFIDIEGTRVHVRDQGPRNAPVIILVHGAGGSLHVWERWVARLATRYRVVSFDLPGHGLTGPAVGQDDTIEAYAALVGGLATRLGIGRFALAGHSMGGMVAWWGAAGPLKTRVTALVLLDASGYPRVGPPSLGLRIARTPVLGEIAAWFWPGSLIVRNLRRAYADPDTLSPSMIERHLDLLRRPGNRGAVLRRVRSFVPPDAEAIRLVRVPTLILWGADDRFVDRGDGQRFLRDIAGSQLVLYEACGHNPMEEQAERSAADVAQFLAANVR